MRIGDDPPGGQRRHSAGGVQMQAQTQPNRVWQRPIATNAVCRQSAGITRTASANHTVW